MVLFPERIVQGVSFKWLKVTDYLLPLRGLTGLFWSTIFHDPDMVIILTFLCKTGGINIDPK